MSTEDCTWNSKVLLLRAPHGRHAAQMLGMPRRGGVSELSGHRHTGDLTNVIRLNQELADLVYHHESGDPATPAADPARDTSQQPGAEE
jgi:hypothetical protein